MKTFISGILVAMLMIAGIVLYTNYLSYTIAELTSLITAASDAAKDGDWQGSKYNIDAFIDLWNCKDDILCAFINHEDLDEIKQSMYELKESIQYNDEQETVKYSSVLIVLIDKLKENELPTLKNILKTNTQYTIRT